MICTQCEGEIPEGATECPHCGAVVVLAESAGSGPAVADILSTPAAPAAPGGSAAAPASGGGATSTFNFDVKRWSQTDRIVGGATLVLFISLFLTWFSYPNTFYSQSGLSGHGYLYIVLLVCLAIFAYLVVRAGMDPMPFKVPVPHDTALLIGTVVDLVLVVIGFLFKPYGLGSRSFGAYLGLIAAIVAAVPLAIPVIQARRKPSS
jgi:hypothetical protein